MLDLLIHNATLPDGRTDMSIAVRDGYILEVTPGLLIEAHEVLDAHDPVEALRLRATRLKVFRRGKLLAQAPSAIIHQPSAISHQRTICQGGPRTPL